MTSMATCLHSTPCGDISENGAGARLVPHEEARAPGQGLHGQVFDRLVRDTEEPRGMVAVNGERRSIAKLIRFTPSELGRVGDQAHASGRPVACFIREASLGSRPRMKNGTVGDTVIHHL